MKNPLQHLCQNARVMAVLLKNQGLAPAVAVAAAELLDAQNLAPQHVKQAYALAPYAGYYPISKEYVAAAVAQAQAQA